MAYVSLVVILALVEYIVFSFLVGKARGRYGIKAPAITGHDMFERYFRLQQNTLEQLVVFIPAIFICAYFLHAVSAAVIGIFFIIGRAIYARAYITGGARFVGMMMTFLTNVTLLLGGIAGIVKSLM